MHNINGAILLAVIFYPNYTEKVPSIGDKVFSYNVFYNGSCLTPFVPLGTKCPDYRYVTQRAIDEAFSSPFSPFSSPSPV